MSIKFLWTGIKIYSKSYREKIEGYAQDRPIDKLRNFKVKK